MTANGSLSFVSQTGQIEPNIHRMIEKTPRAAAYLSEAEKCDEASRCATSADDKTVYQSLADQWRRLARQAEDLRPVARKSNS